MRGVVRRVTPTRRRHARLRRPGPLPRSLPTPATPLHDSLHRYSHPPRQGKSQTSALLALRGLLNGGEVGGYRCAYINVEPEAVEAVWEQTRGQPWPVNALA